VDDAGDSGIYLRQQQKPGEHVVLADRFGQCVRVSARQTMPAEVRAGVTPR
jgi:hypothetical protein